MEIAMVGGVWKGVGGVAEEREGVEDGGNEEGKEVGARKEKLVEWTKESRLAVGRCSAP